MDFFEHQEKARRNSHVLIVYFGLAVLGIILAVYLLLVGVGFFTGSKSSAYATPALDLWQPGLLLATSLGTGLVVFLASAFKTMQLSGGGKVVATELGGRLVDPATADFHERRLLNVVEEMAIASGVPVPEVYVMDSEDSINAFAAGQTTSDAVIGVTRGCMKLLTRDELQGVVAHEFSHILNGDMRLNMRLIGLLFGILFLTLIGEIIMRSGFYSRLGRGGNRDSGGGALMIFALGIGLILIGYIGMFFANLIKASISRQREYLADASAVQFTRNPDGIGGALRKIGALAEGSTVRHPMARDASHLFFGSAFSRSAFSTHPPLHERIRRLLPHWDGDFGVVPVPGIPAEDGETEKPAREETPPAFPFPGMGLAGDESMVALTEAQAAESMRTVHDEQVRFGGEIRRNLPEAWIATARSESGAQAIVYALLLAQDDALRERELQVLRMTTDSRTFELAVRLHDQFARLHSAVKIALIDLTLPTLRRLSPAEYARFRQVMEDLLVSDDVIDLFEFMMQKIVERHLDTYFQGNRSPRIRYHEIGQLGQEAAVILSTLAVLSHPERPEEVREAFSRGSRHFETLAGRPLAFQPAEHCTLAGIKRAIERFEQGSPLVKREFLIACCKTVLTDGKLSSNEAELIRATADAMGCALPPFVGERSILSDR